MKEFSKMRALVFVTTLLWALVASAGLGGGYAQQTVLYALPVLAPTNPETLECANYNNVMTLTIGTPHASYPQSNTRSLCNVGTLTNITLNSSTTATICESGVNTGTTMETGISGFAVPMIPYPVGASIEVLGVLSGSMTQINGLVMPVIAITNSTCVQVTTPTNTGWTAYNSGSPSGTVGPIYGTNYPWYNPGEFEMDLDCVIVFPGSGTTETFNWQGCRNAQTIGASFVPTVTGAAAAILFHAQAGTIYAEGLSLNDSGNTLQHRAALPAGAGATTPQATGITGTYCSDGSCSNDTFHISVSSTSGISYGQLVLSGSGGVNGFAQVVGIQTSAGGGCGVPPCISLGQVNAAGANNGTVLPITSDATNATLSFVNVWYPNFICQNCSYTGLRGDGVFHSDIVVQPEGPVGHICLYMGTSRGNYDGAQLDAQYPISTAHIHNWNVDFVTNSVEAASFTGSITGGNTLNVLSGLTGTIVTGANVCTAVGNCPSTVVSGSGSTWTITSTSNVSSQTITTNVDNFTPIFTQFNATNADYPKYFKNFYVELTPNLQQYNVIPFCSVSSYGSSAAICSNGQNPGTLITWPTGYIQNNGAVIGGDPPVQAGQSTGDFSTTTGQNYVQLPNIGMTCQ